MIDHYVLENKTARPASLAEWAKWFETAAEDRVVAQDLLLSGEVEVSTVFLGLDHQLCAEGPPLLFETCVFGGPLDGAIWRYTTYAEAEEGHQAAILQAHIVNRKTVRP